MVRYFYRPYPLLSFSPNTVPSVAFLSPAEAYPLSHVPQDDPQVVEYHSDILIFHFPNHLNSKLINALFPDSPKGYTEKIVMPKIRMQLIKRTEISRYFKQ